MKLTVAEPKYFKTPISIISELVNEVTFNVKKDYIEVIAMDPANVAMVVFKLMSSAFVDYQVAEDTVLSVNLDQMKQILKRCKPSDSLTLELDENKLYIKLKGESNRVFHISLLDIEEQKQKVPDLKFPVTVQTLTYLFNDAIEDMGVVSDAVLFTAEPDKLTVHSSGNLSSAKVDFASDEDTKIELDGEKIKSKYSIEYLKKIVKGGSLSNAVTLQFGNDYPLRSEYKVLDKLSLVTILAPRVAND